MAVAGPEIARTAGIRLKLFVGNSAIGVGQIDLLQQIGTTGSIRHAAAAMTMDEERAASLLKLMSDGFATPLSDLHRPQIKSLS